MASFQTSRHVPFKAEDMFDLVADVERYPDFLPLCQALQVHRRERLPDGRDIIVADMTVAYKFLRETFGSKVILDRPKLTIDVEYLSGPFSHMKTRWAFRDEPGGSTVTFLMDYAFRSRALSLVAGAVFDKGFRRFADAFETRARTICAPVT